MKLLVRGSLFVGLIVCGPLVQAHSTSQSHGHLSFFEAALHLLQEPDHLALLGGALAVGYLVWRKHKDQSE
jgi:hypothetical protein